LIPRLGCFLEGPGLTTGAFFHLLCIGGCRRTRRQATAFSQSVTTRPANRVVTKVPARRSRRRVGGRLERYGSQKEQVVPMTAVRALVLLGAVCFTLVAAYQWAYFTSRDCNFTVTVLAC
jgi:hypothetical protein